MKLTAILDWYILERLHAEVIMHPPSDDDVRGQVVAAQIRGAFNELTDNLSLAFRDYLFMVSFGEARHAWTLCEGEIPENLPNCSSRNDCYDESLRFAPNRENIDALYAVFDDCYWKADSYGGKAWGKIVKALRLFDKNRAIFIDHVVDLHHNGGSLFDKDDAFNYLDFGLDSYFGDYSLMSFLSCKADSDILDCAPSYFQWVSRKTRGIVWGFFAHFTRGRLPYFPPRDTTVDVPEWYDYTPAEWGDEELSGFTTVVGGYTCDDCGDIVHEDDVYELHGDYYCSSCYQNNFTSCDDCGDTVRNDEITEVPGHYLCDWCFQHHTNECPGCGVIYHQDDTNTLHIGGEYREVCDDCWNNMGECAECGDTVFDADYCADCTRIRLGYFPEQMVLPGLDKYINNEVTS